MGGFTKFLLLFGVGSSILQLFNYDFVILMWINMWGDQIGWLIRIGMIVLGLVLWVVGAASRSGGPSRA